MNRAPGKPIGQVVYDKLRGNSVIVDELGPETLMVELGKVWRSALTEKETSVTEGADEPSSSDDTSITVGGDQTDKGDGGRRLPRRFFGSIPLDPDKVSLQVAKIAEDILFELGRPGGVFVKLVFGVDASLPKDYPDDVVDVVRSNVRDLKLDTAEVGFEEE